MLKSISKSVNYFFQFGLASGLIAGSTLLSLFLVNYVGYRAVGFIFLLSVVAIGLLGSISVVLISASLSTFIWNYFFITPKYTLQISNPEDLLMCLTFFIVAAIIGFLTKLVRDRDEKLAEALRLKDSEKLHQTLLNSISHEMRTPLTAILGSAWALSDDTMARDLNYVKSTAHNLQDAGERLNRVIENLLDMSRLNSGVLSLKMEWHDLHDLVGVVLKKLARPLSKHKIITDLPQDLPLVEMDFRLMEHAISNILLNAALYTPENSEIRILAIKDNKILKINISDNGPGIPESSLLKIFEKFYRVPGSPTGGTGLGLSIVKNIVELHQGHISVTNRAPHGALFFIELPAEKQPELPTEDRHE